MEKSVENPWSGSRSGGFRLLSVLSIHSVRQRYQPHPPQIRTTIPRIVQTFYSVNLSYSRSRASTAKRYRERPCAAAHFRYFSAVLLGTLAPTSTRRA